MLNEYDVVILGGGPAGSATALSLRQNGVDRVLLVESSHYEKVRIGESIPPDTGVRLTELGIWDAFQNENHERCLGSCSSWGSDDLGYNDFMFNPFGSGWHLDRRRFDAFLADQTRKRGVELRLGTSFKSIEGIHLPNEHLKDGSSPHRKGFDLALSDGSVKAKYVVDATGPNARFASKMGSKRLLNDRLIYAVGYYELPEGADFTQLTMLEAVEVGWWYAAKLPDRKLVVALASDPEILRAHDLNMEEQWLNKLQQTRHISKALSESHYIANSFTVSVAFSFRLDKMFGPGWLAVGDAASTYDPISSQGIYKALTDGWEAGKAIAAALKNGNEKFEEHQTSIITRFDDYLINRNYFYGNETRWLEAPFWVRRKERLGVVENVG